jgi:predicted N-formylglutamate amidohydrolase
MSTASFELYNQGGDPRIVFVCDHASNVLPEGYGTLGLAEAQLKRHIAYDIGAAGLTRALATAFGAPAVLARYSRLLIDLNRGPDDPTLVMKLSDGAIVPGNAAADAAEVAKRLALYHAPYHAAIAGLIRQARAQGVAPVLISLHSFTPTWKGRKRPWQIGILWDKDGRLALPLLERLRAEPDLTVGDNEPYDGELEEDCMNRHGTQGGLAHVLIETRQDLIGDEAGVALWAGRLERALRDVL